MQINKVLKTDFSERIIHDLLSIIFRKGAFSTAEKTIFNKLVKLLEIAPAQIEKIKHKVRAKVFMNQEISKADLRNYLNKLRDNLSEILDPIVVDNLICLLAQAFNINIKEIERLNRLTIPQNIRDKYVIDCQEFSLDRSFYYEDKLFALSNLMSQKSHSAYLKILSLRSKGEHGKAINWLNKTSSLDETLRLYLAARFHLECQEYDRARFLLTQSHQMGLRSDLFEEEMFFIDCSKIKFEDSLIRWSKLRQLKSNSVTSKQANAIIRSLIEGLISRNMMHIAHRNLELSKKHYPQLKSDLSLYQPLSEKIFRDFIPCFYGKRFLLIQTFIAVVILGLSSLNLLELQIIYKYLFGLEVQDKLIKPNIIDYFRCFSGAFFWAALLPLIWFNLKIWKHSKNTEKGGYVTLFKDYIQVVVFTKAYHFARKNSENRKLLITQDKISLAGNLFLRAFPFWPGVNFIHGKNLISGKNVTVPLFGVICGREFSRRFSNDTRSTIKPINRIGVRMAQMCEILESILQFKRWTTIYLTIVLFMPALFYVTPLNRVDQNQTIILWIAWFVFLVLIPLFVTKLSKDVSQLGPLIHFNKPNILIGLLIAYYFAEHYYPMGFQGVFPTILLAGFTCFIIFQKSRNFEQQELLANFYRSKVFRKLAHEPKELDSGWTGCHLGLFSPLPITQQSILRLENDTILVRSFFGLITSVHCWITKNNPLVVQNNGRYRRAEIGNGELITSLSSDHLRQTLYALNISNIFKSHTKNIRQIRPYYILFPILITSYGLWLFLIKTDFKEHKYQAINVDVSNILLLTNKNLFRKNKQIDELIYLPERKRYKINYEDETGLVTVLQYNDLTYEELENTIYNSYEFANHPLQNITPPYFIRKRGKRSNLIDLLSWNIFHRKNVVDWDLFGPELEKYCRAIDMQAIPYYGSYRCGFSFSNTQIANFIRSKESIPKTFNLKLLEIALNADGSLLQVMNSFHKSNKHLTLTSIKKFKKPWYFIDKKLRESPSFIFDALQVNGLVLSYLPDEIRNNRNYVLTAIKQNHSSYKYMDSRLWNDLEIVNLILKRDGRALEFVSEKFRNRKDLVLQAVKQNGLAIQYASPGLQKDSEIREISKFVEEGIEFSYIPSGKLFDPLLKKDKNIANFFISSHEIRREIFQRLLGYNPGTDQTDDHPVDNINLRDISKFLDFLNSKSEKTLYRLPTPEEWEYAAKANTKSIYFFGDNSKLLNDYAWYSFNSQGNSQPVGKKLPNPWGLYDIYGNLFEIVAPFPAQYYKRKGLRLPGLASNSMIHGLCSGSFQSVTIHCQPITPDKNFDKRQNEIGFRVIRTLD